MFADVTGLVFIFKITNETFIKALCCDYQNVPSCKKVLSLRVVVLPNPSSPTHLGSQISVRTRELCWLLRGAAGNFSSIRANFDLRAIEQGERKKEICHQIV